MCFDQVTTNNFGTFWREVAAATRLSASVSISLNVVVLSVVLLRGKTGSVAFCPNRLSSKFLEWLFQFCRAEDRNGNTFGVLAGLHHVELALPVSARYAPRSALW